MDHDKVNAFRCVFVQRLQELENKGDRMICIMKENNKSHPDPMDRASLESNIHVEFMLREQDMDMIREIRDAIARIDKGSFGLCEICGNAINERRLLARPTCRFCISCQKNDETALSTDKVRASAEITSLRHGEAIHSSRMKRKRTCL